MANEFGNSAQEFKWFSLRLDAKRDGDLLTNDDNTDGGQHAVNGGDGEELSENARPKDAKEDLQDRRRHADGQGGAISQRVRLGPSAAHSVAAELFNATQDNDDQAGRRPFDGQF